MKKIILIMAVALVSCKKENSFHKAIQGDYEIRTIHQYWGGSVQLPSGAQGYEFIITDKTLTGWHFENNEYEVIDYGVLYASTKNGDSGEINVEVSDSLRLTDIFGNVLVMGSK